VEWLKFPPDGVSLSILEPIFVYLMGVDEFPVFESSCGEIS